MSKEDWELQYCVWCKQMTNHDKDNNGFYECLKCKVKGYIKLKLKQEKEMAIERRLHFHKYGNHTYTIKNDSEEIIGLIERIRNGQWMHYNLTIPLALMEECVKQGCGLTFSPGCQDEIREFCRKLNKPKPSHKTGDSK